MMAKETNYDDSTPRLGLGGGGGWLSAGEQAAFGMV